VRSPLLSLFGCLLALAIGASAAHAQATPTVPQLPPGASATSPVTGALRLQLGIADQKPGLFGDARVRGIGARYVRRAVAWDSFQYDWQVRELDTWFARARAAGLEPLVAWDKSRIQERRAVVPTRAQLRAVFAQFRARYPWIRDFASWNEPNIGGQWPFRRPEEGGRWYRDMRTACPSCRILAADLVDYPNMVSWARRFVRGAGEQPRYWGLHNYVTANRFDASATLALLNSFPGEVWLTEVGGLVAKRNNTGTRLPQGVEHAARVTRFIFDVMARLDRRVTRVYLYHWDAEPGNPTWDSGLVDAQRRARPALAVVRPSLRAPRPAARGLHLGAGVGRVRLGLSRQQLQRAAGRPRRRQGSVWTYGGYTVRLTRGRVTEIVVTDRRQQTPLRTGVGSSRAAILRAHQVPRSYCSRRACTFGRRERGGVISEFVFHGSRTARVRIRILPR